MKKMVKKAILDLNEKGWTRQQIQDFLKLSKVEVSSVLGVNNAGRKPETAKVVVNAVSKPAKVTKKDEKSSKKEVAKSTKKVEKNPVKGNSTGATIQSKEKKSSKKTKVEKVELITLIAADASSSMNDYESITREGLNNYVTALKGIEQNHSKVRVGLLKFATSVEITKPISELENMPVIDSKLYSTNGSTALHDAIATGINLLRSFVNKDKKVDINLTVFTDGEDLCSRTNKAIVKDMVQAFVKDGHSIMFVGPDKKTTRDYVNYLGIPEGNLLFFDVNKKEEHTRSHSALSKGITKKSQDMVRGKFSNTSYFVES